MLIDSLFIVVSWFLEAVFYLFPSATIADLPYIGTDFRAILVQISDVWHAFMETFPYAEIAWDVLVYFIIPFEILLLVAKVLLGSRVPAHTN